jgi:two-component system, LytTR family, sensor kinase
MRVSEKRPGWLALGSGRNLSHNSLFWSLQIAGWVGFGLMMLGYELMWLSTKNAVIGDAASVAAGIGLTTGYRYLHHWGRRRTLSPITAIAVGVTFAIAGSPVWWLTQRLISAPLTGKALPGWHPYLLWSGFNAEVFLFYIFILSTWLLLYTGINGWISIELQRRRADRAVATAQFARLQALQSQLEPHFLFNTLNGISSLVAEGRNEAATATIARLSDFLRLTMQTKGTPEITLEQEMAFVRQYLDIQQLRFGDRLVFEFSITPEAMEAVVPTLILQPLVENAVRHGILPRASGGRVTVSARTATGSLLLNVDDDGLGMRKSTSPLAGLGLSNTATRLAELYGGRAELSVGRSKAGGVGVAIRLPLRVELKDGRPQPITEAAE